MACNLLLRNNSPAEYFALSIFMQYLSKIIKNEYYTEFGFADCPILGLCLTFSGKKRSIIFGNKNGQSN